MKIFSFLIFYGSPSARSGNTEEAAYCGGFLGGKGWEVLPSRELVL
jgi:hypothetical protein